MNIVEGSGDGTDPPSREQNEDRRGDNHNEEGKERGHKFVRGTVNDS